MIKMVRGYGPPPQDAGMDYAGYGVAAREMSNPVSQMRPYPSAREAGLMRAVPALNGFSAATLMPGTTYCRTKSNGRRECTTTVAHEAPSGHGMRGYAGGCGCGSKSMSGFGISNQPADPTVITDSWGIDFTKDEKKAGNGLLFLVGGFVLTKALGIW